VTLSRTGSPQITEDRQDWGVVVLDGACDEAACLIEVERGSRADTVVFERFVPAFDFPIGLRVVGGGFHMGETGHADELLEPRGREAPRHWRVR
jgi:hypothetical protein